MSRIAIGRLSIRIPHGANVDANRLAEAIRRNLQEANLGPDQCRTAAAIRRSVNPRSREPDRVAESVAAEVIRAIKGGM